MGHVAIFSGACNAACCIACGRKYCIVRIRELIDVRNLSLVPSKMNPADIATQQARIWRGDSRGSGPLPFFDTVQIVPSNS